MLLRRIAPAAVLAASAALTAGCASSSGTTQQTTTVRPATTAGPASVPTAATTGAAGDETEGPLGDLLGRLSEGERSCLSRETGGAFDVTDASGFEKVFGALVACRPAAFVQDMADSARNQAGLDDTKAACATTAVLDRLKADPALIKRMAAGADVGADLRRVVRTPLQSCGLSAEQIDSLTS